MLLLSNKSSLVLAYRTQSFGSSPRDSGSVAPETEPALPSIALVRFGGIRAVQFGLPNDETLTAHPLYNRGLHWYAAQEVERSSWIRQLERRNRAHPRYDPAVFERLHHYLVTLTDSTFECVAEGLSVSHFAGARDMLLDEMHRVLQAHAA